MYLNYIYQSLDIYVVIMNILEAMLQNIVGLEIKWKMQWLIHGIKCSFAFSSAVTYFFKKIYVYLKENFPSLIYVALYKLLLQSTKKVHTSHNIFLGKLFMTWLKFPEVLRVSVKFLKAHGQRSKFDIWIFFFFTEI